MWVCRCECGGEKMVLGGALKRGKTRSCGCLSREALSARRRLPEGVSTMNNILSGYKNGARTRGLAFELTDEETLHLMRQNCFYCEAAQSNKAKGNYGSAEEREANSRTYQGIDRLNNAIGYTIDNTVPCCKICNYAKRDLSFEEYMAHLARQLRPQQIRAKIAKMHTPTTGDGK